MSEWAIETLGLRRAFGSVQAVDGVDLKVPRGGVYGFLGPNGAGKTTTIRLMLGLLRPQAGRIALLGEAMPKSALQVMGRVGALVEQPSSYPHLSARENLSILARMRGLDGRAVEEALTLVKLGDAAGRKVKTYSLGMRQRLGLAQALLGRPELLILDEPTNGLDPAGIREMRGFIRELPAAWGVTVFLSSHLLSEVEQVATHLGVIRRGRMVFQGTPADLQKRVTARCVVGVDRPQEAQQWLARVEMDPERNVLPLNGTREG